MGTKPREDVLSVTSKAFYLFAAVVVARPARKLAYVTPAAFHEQCNSLHRISLLLHVANYHGTKPKSASHNADLPRLQMSGEEDFFFK